MPLVNPIQSQRYLMIHGARAAAEFLVTWVLDAKAGDSKRRKHRIPMQEIEEIKRRLDDLEKQRPQSGSEMSQPPHLPVEQSGPLRPKARQRKAWWNGMLSIASGVISGLGIVGIGLLLWAGSWNKENGKFTEAVQIFTAMSTAERFEEFLTLPAYEHIVERAR